MDTDFDFRDILLEAQAEFASMMTEVMQKLALPQMVGALRMQWMTMPDETKEMLKQQNPDMYKRMLEMISNQ